MSLRITSLLLCPSWTYRVTVSLVTSVGLLFPFPAAAGVTFLLAAA